jgi:light-regulated signal transduction histidine kinase (bacteriophytochrome)
MGILIDDLLAFSHLSRSDIKVQSVKPKPIVHQALNDLQDELVDRDLEFIIGEMCECQSDPAMLRQVFVNLLQNAIKFTRRRDPSVIEVGCRSENNTEDKSLYFVKDNGVGFDMRYVDKLFGVFQRLHRAEDYEGTGVGLATVERIIHRHGGEIWAESQVDKGTTIYFTLPAKEVEKLG